MNGRFVAEAFGEIDDRFLAEAFETMHSESVRERRITLKKKKIVAAAVAAAIAAALAVTAAAVYFGGLQKMKGFLDGINESHNVPEALTGIDPEKIGVELDASLPEPGKAKLTSIVAGKHGFIATLAFNANGTGLTDGADLEDGTYVIEWPNFEGVSNGETVLINSTMAFTFVSEEDGILTFAARVGMDDGEGRGIPDELTLTASGIAYAAYENFQAQINFYSLEGQKMSVSSDEYTALESKRSLNTAEYVGAEFYAELDEFGVYFSAPEMTEEQYQKMVDAAFDAQLEFKMKDGTVIKNRLFDFGVLDDGGAMLLGGYTTNKTGVFYQFGSLVDTDQIASVSMNGVEFVFSK